MLQKGKRGKEDCDHSKIKEGFELEVERQGSLLEKLDCLRVYLRNKGLSLSGVCKLHLGWNTYLIDCQKKSRKGRMSMMSRTELRKP